MNKDKEFLSLSNNEKIPLLYGDCMWHTFGVPSLNLRPLEMHDGPVGLRKVKDGRGVDGLAPSTIATCFPSPCLLACSFDPELEYQVGQAIGQETLEQNVDILLAPGVNIKRNPLCGRNFEYFSEDPLLAGKMGAGFINGLQSVGIGACLKHFACNSQEFERLASDSIVDKRAMHELYLKPFEIAVKESHPYSLMCAYNMINGVYASDNDYLLKDVLRKQWGFDGVVMSDWGATVDYVYSHSHGLDLEMPAPFPRKKDIAGALKRGTFKQEDLDECSYNVYSLIKKCLNGKKESPNVNPHEVALKGVLESAVLLKNENVLPLRDFSSCCIIGPFAKTPRYQGNGSSHVITDKLVDFVSLTDAPYVPGFDLDEPKPELVPEAVELAKQHERVILFLGLASRQETEGVDRAKFDLPNDQLELFDQVYEVNKHITVVLSCGSPVNLPFKDKADSILLLYLGGEAMMEGAKMLLLGKANPSGRLSESWPLEYKDVPSHNFYPGKNKQAVYKESIFVGYRYYVSADVPVAYPFGYGLSYSHFSYRDLVLSSSTYENGSLEVNVKIKNDSLLPAKHTVLLFIRGPQGRILRPLRELKAFQKVELGPNEEKEVTLKLDESSFEVFDTESDFFKIQEGKYVVEIASDCNTPILSASVNVVSTYRPDFDLSSVPSFYPLSKKGLDVSNDEFFFIYGKSVPAPVDRSYRPYDLNCTLEDIQGTFVGKTMKKFVFKKFDDPNMREEDKAMSIAGALTSPLRAGGMMGMKDKYLACLIDLANRKIFRCFKHLMFGLKK